MDPDDGTWPPYQEPRSSGTATLAPARPRTATLAATRSVHRQAVSPDLTARIEQLRVNNREIGEVREHIVTNADADPKNPNYFLVYFEGCSNVQRYDIRDPDAGSSIFVYAGETVIIDENGYLLPL